MNSILARSQSLLHALVTVAVCQTLGPWISPAQGQPSPAAIQAPAYRQPGSAYVPPPLSAPPTQSAPGFQPGFGTPPAKGPAPKSSAKSTPKAAPKPAPKPTTSTSTIETRLSRLEKNDARQDQRLISLEAGAARPSGGMAAIPATASGKTYVVRPGDQLAEIATRHGTTTAALRSVNGLPNDEIYIGQTLDIPSPTSFSPPQETSLGGIHIVRPGDIFSVLAAQFGVTQDALARANPSVYPDKLLIGERLRIPSGARQIPASQSNVSQPSTRITTSTRTHTVGRGESLGAIAKKYGIPTASLASTNRLRNPNHIVPGQRLTIPGTTRLQPAAPQISSPTAIASAESDLTALPNALLLKPAAPAASAPEKSTPTQAAAPAYPTTSRQTSNPSRGVVAYRLERGDNLTTVANMFSTSEENIRQMNKLPSDKKLKEGDEIVVPALGAVSLN